MTLFKLHFIVIFMYTTIFIIVLWKIPYRYDRIKKTKSEKKAIRKAQRKKRNKKKKTGKNALNDSLAKDIQDVLLSNSRKEGRRPTTVP